MNNFFIMKKPKKCFNKYFYKKIRKLFNKNKKEKNNSKNFKKN